MLVLCLFNDVVIGADLYRRSVG